MLPPAFAGDNGFGGGRQKSSDTDLPLWGATKPRSKKTPAWLFFVAGLAFLLIVLGKEEPCVDL